MAGEILHPKVLIVPKMSQADRDLMKAELGTLIYNTNTDKLNFCDVAFTANATSWALVTSV